MRIGETILMVILATLAAFAITAKAHCAEPLFDISVLDARNQPVRVAFAPVRLTVRLRFRGQLSGGQVCFVAAPEHSSCMESDRPYPAVVTRMFELREAGEHQFYAMVGNVRSNVVQVVIEEGHP